MAARRWLWVIGAMAAGAAMAASLVLFLRPRPPAVPYRAPLPAGYRALSAGAEGAFYARVATTAVPTAWLALGEPAADHACLRFSEGAAEWLRVSAREAVVEARATLEAGHTVELSRRGGELLVYSGGRRLMRRPMPPGRMEFLLFSADPQARLALQKLAPVRMSDDFMRERVADGDGWTAASGRWRSEYTFAATSPNPFMCQGFDKNGDAILLAGHHFWNDAEYAAALKPEDAREAGLVFAWRDARNYCRAVVRRAGTAGQAALVRVRDGREEPLGGNAVPILFPGGRWVRLSVTCTQGSPTGAMRVDGRPLLDLPPDLDTFGKAGFFVRQGGALFDDFAALDVAETDAPPALAARSRVYSVKERYARDDRDDWLYRWARGLDAWQPFTRRTGEKDFGGEYFHLPLFGDFLLRTEASSAPARVVLLHPDGEIAQDVPLPGPGAFEFRRAGGEILLNGQRAGQWPAGRGARVGILTEGGRPSGAPAHRLYSPAVREELFDGAPSDWAPVQGQWENTSRWRCKQEWGFFSGQSNDCAALFSKQRFEGNQTHLFYYGLKDVFGRQFQNDRYARRDVNFSFMTDGRDLFSGYTFLYGGYENAGAFLLRGREIVARNDKARFAEDQGIEDQHLFWRRIRVDCAERRIRVRLEDEVLIDYAETSSDAPRGGHVALWTRRNGVMYARLNSSAESIHPAPEPYLLGEASDADLPWRALEPGRLLLRAAPDGMTRVQNRWGGGDFAVEYPLPHPVDLNVTPVLRMRLDIPENVKVNLHVRVGYRYFVLSMTAPTRQTYRILGNPADEPANVSPDWRLLAAAPLAWPDVGGEPQGALRGEWRINLRDELRRRLPAATDLLLHRLVVGNTSHADYLMAGLSGNPPGAAYALSAPSFEP